MDLKDYPNSAVDVMLSHRYSGMGPEAQNRPLTPTSRSEMDSRSSQSVVRPGASAMMFDRRYNY